MRTHKNLTFRSKAVSIALTLIVLIVAIISAFMFLPSSAAAHASEHNYDDLETSVYYFTDYYTTLDEDVIRNGFGEEYPELAQFSFELDHKYITKQQFTDMVNNGYFSELGWNRVVVIDIKTFMPDPQDLVNLFDYLKYTDCITVFVSVYSEADYLDAYGENEFLNFVDLYVDDGEMVKLALFTYLTSRHIHRSGDYNDPAVYEIIDLAYQNYFLDGNIININKYIDPFLECHDINIGQDGDRLNLKDHESYEGELPDMNTLCEDSPFLKKLLNALTELYNINHAMNGSEIDYNSVAENLIRNTRIDDSTYFEMLVHYKDNIFIDILDWHVLVIDDYAEYVTTHIDYKQLVAIGFWRIDNDFYKILWEMQYFMDFSHSQEQKFEKIYDIPLYALPVDPYESGLNPIWGITYKELLEMYGLEQVAKELDVAGNALFDGLLELLNS